MKVQPLLPKQKVPDHGQSQRENHSHSKTSLHDYHDSAANMINAAFHSYRVNRQRTYSHFQTKTPRNFVTQSMKITSHVVHFQSEKQKKCVFSSHK